MGGYDVPMALHLHNRTKLLTSLRQHLHSRKLPLSGFVLLQDLSTCKSYLFAPRLPEDYTVWYGKIHPPSYFKDMYGVDEAYYVDEMIATLKTLSPGVAKPMLYLLYGLNTDSDHYSKPAVFQGMDEFETDLETLHPILAECRVIKSHYELDLLRYVNKISSDAHVKVMQNAGVDMKEYQLESLFLHHVYMYGGCRHVSYTCICGTGENSAVLHYGHAAAPNDRTIKDGDLALLDMGAEYHFYDSDITCSFPVNGIFTKDQRNIYQGVLDAQKAVMAKIKPGISWVEMHRLAERKILEALKKADILKGDIDHMLGKRLGGIFMPHGLGHFLGLDIHDPGGYLKGAVRLTGLGLKSLRTTRVLEEGMVITVEPGCYFIDDLLDEAIGNPETSCFINREELERFRGFGGVRLEDNIVVTGTGYENLTKCPREIHDVEAVMAGASWSE